MKKFELLAASAIALIAATPAMAQDTPTPATAAPAPAPQADDQDQIGDIVITAQRQSETLQTVPIAVSAFSSEALKAQQINTTSDLQLTLPNITFTKSNFTSSSSFNIRGIGDLCVGVTCDAATAIHVNDVPVLGSPIFQNEYFDVERIEVLRGPQGTLFGRNATGGVINFITAKPDLSGIHASGDVEYGNYNSIRVKGMLNIPLGEVFGVRVAGYYLNRDGFTKNLSTNSNIDGRDQYDVRVSLRFQPTANTTLDIVAHYFKENDDRSRVQKQLCHRDPTGVLGCLPDRLAFEQVNGDATLASVLTSSQFLRLRTSTAPLAGFALGSVYGTDGDSYTGYVNPADMRTVNIDSLPTFKTNEKQVLVNFSQDFGKALFKLDGGYTEGMTDSSVDYNIGIERSYATNPGLNLFNTLAGAGLLGPGYQAIRNILLPNGNTSTLCQSLAEPTGTGVYSGHKVCASTSLDFDRSTARGKQWFAEGIISSKLDGPFNFLAGAGYLDYKVYDNSYYVNSFALDYAAGLLGGGAGNVLGTPFYRNDSEFYHLKSYGFFGEAYVNFSDKVKLTGGLRYNHDEKDYQSRTNLLNCPVPVGAANAYASPGFACYDADPLRTGNQPLAINNVSFGRLTGRAVLDWQITSRNLLYASYSRGYKSGGINPSLAAGFSVPLTFGPETVNAFEIGSKNTFLGGTLRLNLTAFYYQYKQLQLSRIVARTSVNDNVDADIYGAEAEAIIKPSNSVLINLTASYLHTKVSNDKFLGNPQDPSGGRADAVIIKDVTNGSNCAVVSNSGNAAISNNFVNGANAAINAGAFAAQGFPAQPGNFQGTTPIPGTNTTGAFGVCDLLTAFANATAAPVTVLPSGVAVNIKGNELPQSPHYKFSAGIQWTGQLGNDWNITPRVDLAYTGGYYGSIFNNNVNRIQGYEVINAQLQLNGPSDKFYVRAFIQNVANNNAITGLYVTDQSSGLFTNAFTLEPRRYGLAAGFKF